MINYTDADFQNKYGKHQVIYNMEYSSSSNTQSPIWYLLPEAAILKTMNNNYFQIADKFITRFEIAQNNNFVVHCEKSFIIESCLSIIKELSNLDLEKINIEFTLDSSILFTSKFLDTTIYNEAFFDKNYEINEIEIITNIYQCKKQIFTCLSDIEGTIEAVQEQTVAIRNYKPYEQSEPYLSKPSGAYEKIPDYGSYQFSA